MFPARCRVGLPGVFERFVMNKIRNWGAATLATVVTSAAMAQATDPFTTAVDEITTKVETYGLALVGLAAVGVVFMIAMKYVKKLRSAA